MGHRARGRRNQSRGSTGESIGQMCLRLKGCKMVAEMPVPFVTLHARNFGGVEYLRIKRSAKVFGDIRAVLPDTGRSVLAEVKTVSGDRLVHSKLRPHQVRALDEHHELGGVSLLIWASDYGTYCMRWPIPGFQKGRSIKVAEAPVYEWEGV